MTFISSEFFVALVIGVVFSVTALTANVIIWRNALVGAVAGTSASPRFRVVFQFLLLAKHLILVGVLFGILYVCRVDGAGFAMGSLIGLAIAVALLLLPRLKY